MFQLVKTFAPPNQLQPYLPVIAPNELVIPVTVGPLGFATYFVTNQASQKFSDAEEIWASPSNTETKAPPVLKNEVNEVASICCLHYLCYRMQNLMHR
jgi:hypothetical protein